MDTDEYQAKLNALGVDRGKLASGFGETSDTETVEKPNDFNGDQSVTGNPVTPTASHPVKPDNSPRPVNKCRCGVTIGRKSNRCSICVRQDRQAKRLEMERSGVSLPVKPSPPPPLAAPEEKEPVILWHVLGEPEILKIAEAVITGNGGVANEDDIIAAVEELTRSQVGSTLCTLVLRGEIGIRCQKGKVSYMKLGAIAIDWDYVI